MNQASDPAPASASPDPGDVRLFRIDATRSKASYEAQEKWGFWPAPTKAVASTNQVAGEFALKTGEAPELRTNHFTVDLSTLTSEQGETPQPSGRGFNPLNALPSRDGVVRGRLDTDTHPLAEFTATELTGLPARYVEGQEAAVRVLGNLTIRGVTRPVVFDTKATLQGTELSGAATTHFNMSDFGVQPPDVAAVRVEDPVTIVLQFSAITDN